MSRRGWLIAALAAGLAVGAQAADKAADRAPAGTAKKIRMGEPMSTGMMKPGMMKGEVRGAAEKKTRAMQPLMEQEEKSMPAPAAARP